MRQGLFIISIENIREPEIIAEFDQYGDVRDVAIEGNLAALSTEETGLILMDISNIREPEEISIVDCRCGKALIQDNLIYALGYEGSIYIINIQDIENPEIVQRFGITPSADFEIAGDRLIMTLDTYEGSWRSAVGIYVYSLEDPIRPEQTGRFLSIGLASDVVFKDDLLFLLEGINWEQYVEEEDVYHAPKLNIFSAADPMNLGYLSSYTVWDWDEELLSLDHTDVDLIGEHVYFTVGLYGLFVLNIRDRQRPRLVGSLRTECWGITVDETHAFISATVPSCHNSTNMLIIDITDPTDPNEIAEIDTEDAVWDMIKTGDLVYIANSNRGLTIINVADPANPEEIGNLQGHNIHTVKVQDGIAYALVFYEDNEADWGMWIIDVSDPANPQEITFFQWGCRPHSLDVQGNFVIVTSETPNSICIMDISDPANPEITGTYFDNVPFNGVALNEEFAYIACSSHLKTFDCSGAMEIIQPPEWVNEPEPVSVEETDSVEFELTAVDPNGDEIVLEIDRQNLPENAEFTDDGDGRGHFRWVTGYDDAGEYNPRFTASDGEDESSIIVNIQVENLNRAPFLINQLDDIVHIEDGGRLEIALLDTIFHDPDDEELQYIIIDAPELLGLSIGRDGVLTINPEQDYNLPGGVEIALLCQDAEGAAVGETFNIVIEPVNDAPTRFGLLSPADRAVVEENEATFIWQASTDIDSDSVGYCLNLHIVQNEIDTVFRYETGIDTSVLVGTIDSISSGLRLREQITATWFVEASDGLLNTESFNQWEIVIPFTQSIRNNGSEIPIQYSLGLNYPNPFNSTTTIPFSLPISGHVRLSVYDIYGRFEADLVYGQVKAGYHQAVWNAHNPAGIYFYRLMADGYTESRKMVLVK